MWTEQNPRVPLGVIAMISEGCTPILSWSLYLGLFFISIHQHCMLFWIGIGHILVNVMERENQIGAWSRSWLWLYHTKRLSCKPRTSWALSLPLSLSLSLSLSLFIYLNQCEELLSKLLEANLQIYLEWSWQLMQFYCFFHQWMIVYLFIFKVAGVDYEINSINGYLYRW